MRIYRERGVPFVVSQAGGNSVVFFTVPPSKGTRFHYHST